VRRSGLILSTYPEIALAAVPRAAYSQECGGDLSHIFLRRGRVPFGYGAGSILKYFSEKDYFGGETASHLCPESVESSKLGIAAKRTLALLSNRG